MKTKLGIELSKHNNKLAVGKHFTDVWATAVHGSMPGPPGPARPMATAGVVHPKLAPVMVTVSPPSVRLQRRAESLLKKPSKAVL